MSSIMQIVNQTNTWAIFKSGEWYDHNRMIGPQGSVSFQWKPWVPWCGSQAQFDDGHYHVFTSGATGTWWLYERWGELRVFRDGYESGAMAANWPRKPENDLIIYLGPGRDEIGSYRIV